MLYISLAYHASPTREPSSYQSTQCLRETPTRGLTIKSIAKLNNYCQIAKLYPIFFYKTVKVNRRKKQRWNSLSKFGVKMPCPIASLISRIVQKRPPFNSVEEGQIGPS